MRIDIDTYHEIVSTLTRNKSRSFLTGFGVIAEPPVYIPLQSGPR